MQNLRNIKFKASVNNFNRQLNFDDCQKIVKNWIEFKPNICQKILFLFIKPLSEEHFIYCHWIFIWIATGCSVDINITRELIVYKKKSSHNINHNNFHSYKTESLKVLSVIKISQGFQDGPFWNSGWMLRGGGFLDPLLSY